MARVVLAANSTFNLRNFRGGLIRELLRAGHEVLTISPDRERVELGTVMLPHRQCEMVRSGTNPFQDGVYLYRLLRILRAERPDVFLGFTIKPNVYGCLACAVLGIRAIPNVSGLGTAFLAGRGLRRTVLFLYRFAFRHAHRVFFQNKDDEALFCSEGVVKAQQSRVLPGSGVDLGRFRPSGLPANLRFLMIGRLLADKGVREFVAAAKEVKQNIPLANFALLGDLDHENRTAIGREELEEWVREGVVSYLGSTPDVRPFIREAAVIVLPSYREGLSRTLLEAAAMGRPLIATNVPGCREVVRDGLTGFLCEARDASSLARAMERFALASDAERTRLGARARAMAEGEFDEAFVARAYLDAIPELPARGGGALAGEYP